jgi:hypothetical protein
MAERKPDEPEKITPEDVAPLTQVMDRIMGEYIDDLRARKAQAQFESQGAMTYIVNPVEISTAMICSVHGTKAELLGTWKAEWFAGCRECAQEFLVPIAKEE